MTTCSGSGTRGHTGVFPGDTDRCTHCGRRIKVREDGLLGKHTRPKRAMYLPPGNVPRGD